MKKYIITATIAAVLSMISAPAMAQVSGYVSGSYGRVTVDSGTSTDLDATGIDGAISVPIGTGMVIQGNLGFGHLDGDTTDADSTAGSAHFGLRNDTYALGAYVAVKDNDVVNDTSTVFGGEYVMYMPQMTVSLGAGFGKFDDLDADITGAEAEGRYFFSDNLRLDGRVTYNKVDSTGSDSDGFGVGIGGEWKPDSLPVSFFAGYDWTKLDSGGTDTDISVASIGVRFDFGSGTLKARDRSGPAFKAAAGFDGAFSSVF